MSGVAPHWAEISETTSVAGIRLLCAIYRALGRRVFRICAAPVVCTHWLLNAPARRASLQYLRRLHAHTGVFEHPPGWWASLRHFSVFADTLLDKILALGGQYPSDKVRISRDNMIDLLRKKRGAVIVTAHIGCLELCQALSDRVPEFRMTVLVHTRHAEQFNRLLARLPGSGKIRLMQVQAIDLAVAAQLGECMNRGEFVAITGDRMPLTGNRHVFVDFLGQPAPFPIGPYVLAAALRCPLVTMVCVHQGDGYVLHFETFANRVELPRAARDAALTSYATRFARWLEAQLRAAPYDWFNFFAFWDQPTYADSH
ncbi:MAG: acyltransferase [Burkholderiaceae bacterium]|jgi:predicted LPLAT superfamily acyltransferase|nr:acyltransferase [Burkholderiaceae bacterium]